MTQKPLADNYARDLPVTTARAKRLKWYALGLGVAGGCLGGWVMGSDFWTGLAIALLVGANLALSCEQSIEAFTEGMDSCQILNDRIRGRLG